MPFQNIRQLAIVGTGLLGGSLGLAIRAAGFRGTITGIARRQQTLDQARSCGCIDRGTSNLAEGVRDCGLIFLAAPVLRIPELMQELSKAEILPDAILTDVGSTKVEIVQAAERFLPVPGRFVGSHPMAGDTASGPEAARADLFADKPCILTPTTGTQPQVLNFVKMLWQTLGMRLLEMSPLEHDRMAASISHLPHLLAALLVENTAQLGGWEIASTGFRDTSRLASSAPQMRLEIIQTNRSGILEALTAYGKRLEDCRKLLESGDDAGMLKLLESACNQRNTWLCEQGWRDTATPPGTEDH